MLLAGSIGLVGSANAALTPIAGGNTGGNTSAILQLVRNINGLRVTEAGDNSSANYVLGKIPSHRSQTVSLQDLYNQYKKAAATAQSQIKFDLKLIKQLKAKQGGSVYNNRNNGNGKGFTTNLHFGKT